MSDAVPPTWVYCECDWESMSDADLLCGCRKHVTRPYRDNVIHWRGHHWALKCAFAYAVQLIDHMRDADIRQAVASIEYERIP